MFFHVLSSGSTLSYEKMCSSWFVSQLASEARRTLNRLTSDVSFSKTTDY
jgi:hypothetical protein